tara:strand:+ start:1116 stop:1550 length:435 start_codon:yes stop_codon:yes gene_type:complete
MDTIIDHSSVEDMEKLLGKWKLKDTVRFTDFLSFTRLPWYQIQIANYSTIDLHLTKLSEMKYSKKVESLFYNVNHTIDINNIYKECDDGKKIKYSISDNKIITDIIGTIVNWQEIISFNDPYLQIEYVWEEKGETKTAQQIFEQ